MSSVQELSYATLSLAEGGIDPAERVATGEITEYEIEDFARRSQTDEFDEAISQLAIPCMCVDGRCGHCALGPNASGGTFSLVMGEALTDASSVRPGETAAQHAKRVYGSLLEKGYRIGGHDDANAGGEKSGCGAQDKLDLILDYISRRSDDIRELLASLDILIDDQLHDLITSTAEQRLAGGYVTDGGQLKKAFTETAGAESVDTVEGAHGEVILRINTQTGTTLNRRKVKAAFGDKIQAFNLDVPGLFRGIEAISQTAEEAQRKFLGALYYNVATAAVLAGPSMRIVVR